MRNVELLEAIADKIESEPELWEQKDFTTFKDCGTAHCIAGWANELTKYSIRESGETYVELFGLTFEETYFLFYHGMDHTKTDHAHKETAEWLRGIARGEDVFATAPTWWREED